MSEENYSTYEVAQICGVTMIAVIKWIDQGKLPAYRTPGGHRRVLESDLLAFLKRYEMPIPESLNAQAKKRILIVDDDASEITAVKRALKRIDAGFEVYQATEAFEAGEKIADLHPALVILNLKFSGIDGLKICRWIRYEERFRDMKIWVISNFWKISSEKVEAYKKEVLDSGADEFLSKPLDVSILKEKIQVIFGIGDSRVLAGK